MDITEEKIAANRRRNLRRKRKVSAERKKVKRQEEKQQRIALAKTTRQEKEDARQKKREQLLAAGARVTSNGAVIPTKISATGKVVSAGGRKDKRTDKFVVEKLLAALRQGHTLTDAATFAGVAYVTVNTWLNQGAQAEEGTLAKEFFDKVELARAESVGDCIKSIKKAAKRGAWQAAAWFLEKRAPETYGKKSEVTIGQNKPFEVALVDAAFSEEEMQAALKAVLSQHPELAPSVVIDAEVVE
jgi:transposase